MFGWSGDGAIMPEHLGLDSAAEIVEFPETNTKLTIFIFSTNSIIT